MSEVDTPSSESTTEADEIHPGSPSEGDATDRSALLDRDPPGKADAAPNEEENKHRSPGLSDSEDSEASLKSDSGTAMSAVSMMKKLERLNDRLGDHDIAQFLDDFRPLWMQGTKSVEDYLISPLHAIARERRFDADLIPQIIQVEPDIMLATNLVGKAAMHIAIEHKNYPALAAMLDNYENIDEVLRMKDTSGASCLHLAFQFGLNRRHTLALIKKASKKTLCEQDEKGRTPLHKAVHYRLCNSRQPMIIRELLDRCDEALDCFTKEKLSVYQYHLQTQAEETIAVDKAEESNNAISSVRAAFAPAENVRPKAARTRENGIGSSTPKKHPASKESAEEVAFMLKVHYLRSTTVRHSIDFGCRSPNQAQRFFFGNSSGPTPLLSFEPPPTPPLDRMDFEWTCRSLEFFDVMRSVSLPAKFEVRDNENVKARERRSLDIPFKWLRENQSTSVKKIIRVFADDLDNEPYSNESIEEILGPFNVEELCWRKNDICPKTIRHIGNELRILYLHWGGNNAVLRSWSEPDGLPRLRKLEQVTVTTTKFSESWRRIKRDLKDFEDRLRALRPAIKVTTIAEDLSELVYESSFARAEPQNQLDRWFHMIEEFLGSIARGRNKFKTKRSSVALIDTAVNIFERDLTKQIASVVGCDLYPITSAELGSSHGTHMARAITQTAGRHMSPLIVLESHSFKISSRDLSRYFSGSLAEAIRNAILRQVDIICISWYTSAPKVKGEEIREALLEASDYGIIIFCLPSDGDLTTSEHTIYPAGLDIPGLYRVGSVSGNEWPSVEVRRRQKLDLILPSRIRNIGAEPSAEMDDSAAPAIAAGLAAILLDLWEVSKLEGKVRWNVKSRHDLIRKFISYISDRQDAEQNLSFRAGWEGFQPMQSKDRRESKTAFEDAVKRLGDTYFGRDVV